MECSPVSVNSPADSREAPVTRPMPRPVPASPSSRPAALVRRALRISVAALLLVNGPRAALASDHADPIDPFDSERQESGITDLFAFPILENGEIAFPYDAAADGIPLSVDDAYLKKRIAARGTLSDDDRSKVRALAVILDVRRALTDRSTLKLSPYTYAVHMDTHSPIVFGDSAELPDAKGAPAGPTGYPDTTAPRALGTRSISLQEATLRYGGLVAKPDEIKADVTITVRLNDDTTLHDLPQITGLNECKVNVRNEQNKATFSFDPNRINIATGVFDDPFIFPGFFGTNTVGIVMTIPIKCFRGSPKDWLLWGTTHEGDRQIDHVGRSLRTQNPRFNLLNTLPPSEHVAAILEEHTSPSLVRDLALRFNLGQIAAYRAWDGVPDVMIYSSKYRVGFPNGRVPTDDVAALLAQFGDTLLLELSYHLGGWPRKTTNDVPFLKEFPWLPEPPKSRPDKPQKPPVSLAPANKMKLVGIALALLALLVLSHWLFAKWYHRRQEKKRYL
jgi:hypothetical protein